MLYSIYIYTRYILTYIHAYIHSVYMFVCIVYVGSIQEYAIKNKTQINNQLR